MISTGKYLQRREKFDDAIQIFEIAVKLDAKAKDISYGYELIGECCNSKGDRRKALDNYRRALAISPDNKNAQEMIKNLGGE